jgi:hypothetical protein
MCKPPCRLLSVAVIAFWVGLCPSAFASLITYTDRSAWEAASVDLTNIDFEGITPPGTRADFSSTGLTLSGAHFDGFSQTCFLGCTGGRSLFVDNTSGNAQLSGVGQLVERIFSQTGTITVSFQDPITSFGSDFVFFTPNNEISLFSGTSYTSLVPNNSQFVGFTSSEPVSQITVYDSAIVSAQRADANLDNVAFGTAAVPEPSTSFLLLCGCSCLAVPMLLRKAAV